MILQRVSPVTHSIGNSVKRVVVIASSILVFRNPVTQQASRVGWCTMLRCRIVLEAECSCLGFRASSLLARPKDGLARTGGTLVLA